MRIFGGISLIVVFVLWVLYRLLIKKDLKQNLSALGIYSAFIVVWILIYVYMLYL